MPAVENRERERGPLLGGQDLCVQDDHHGSYRNVLVALKGVPEQKQGEGDVLQVPNGQDPELLAVAGGFHGRATLDDPDRDPLERLVLEFRLGVLCQGRELDERSTLHVAPQIEHPNQAPPHPQAGELFQVGLDPPRLLDNIGPLLLKVRLAEARRRLGRGRRRRLLLNRQPSLQAC